MGRDGGSIQIYRGGGEFGTGLIATNPYYLFYRSQSGHGAGIPIYIGADQYGRGFGSVLKGLWRTVYPFLAPIAAKAASGFISNAATRLKAGDTVWTAAKGSIKPDRKSVV